MVECVNCAKFKGCDLSSPNVNECADYTEKLTNEEWLRTATTKQLAEWLCHISDFCEICEKHCDNDTGMQCNGDFKERWVEWLKQPHKE